MDKSDKVNKLKKIAAYRDAKQKELEYLLSTRFRLRLLMGRGATVPYILPVNYYEVE